jgi:hypothetical protein
MTLAEIATLLFEPRATRYIGRHRAPEVTTFVAIASAPRTLVSAVRAVSAVSAVGAASVAPSAGATPVTD